MSSSLSISRPRLQWTIGVVVTALIALCVLRLTFVDGLLRRVLIDGPSMAPAFCGEHYRVSCGDCGFGFRCDAEHLPADGRAACPNCGFANNRLDQASRIAAERVLMDRWPLLFREARRGEVVAVRLPGGDLAVKRIAGLPGEELAIREGDLFAGERILRKSRAQLRDVRVLIHDNDFRPREASGLPARWRGGDGWLEYEHWPCTTHPRLRGVASPVTDNDGYNQGESHRPLNAVSDVWLTCRLRIEGGRRFSLAAVDGKQRFELEIEAGRCVVLRSARETLVERPLLTSFSRRPVEIEFGLCDRQVFLAVAGRTVVRYEYERAAGSPVEVVRPLAIGAAGAGVDVTELRVWRDVFYLDPQGLSRRWEIPVPLGAGEFAVLGDNQPVSIDSRHWEVAGVGRKAMLGLVYRAHWMGGGR